MGVLSILARLAFDGTQFDSGIKKAERTADKFANKTMNKLGGLAAGAFGINALKQMGLAAIENATEISTLAKQFNITTDQVQLLKEEAERTGTPFAQLVKEAGELEKTLKRLDGGNVIFSRETIERLTMAGEAMKIYESAVGERAGEIIAGLIGLGEGVKLTPEQRAFEQGQLEKKRADEAEKQGEKERLETEEKIRKINAEAAEFENKARDAGLVKAEKIVQLEKERAAILRDLEVAQFDEGTEGAANDRLRLAKVNARLAELRKDNPDAKVQETRKQLSPLSDSLTSVGNFLGGNANAPQMKLLDDANRLLRQIERNTGRQGGTAFPL